MTADPRTLLLVASSANLELLRTPRDMGLSVIVASRARPAAGELYDQHLEVDELDEDAVAEAVQQLTATGRRIDAVACFHEGSLRAAARVAADLGLPGNSIQAVMNMRDKAQCTEVLTAARVPCPRSRLVSSAAEAVEMAREFGYPAVIKPQSSGASQGVTKVADDDEARTCYELIAHLHERTEFRQGPFAVRNVGNTYMDPQRRGVLLQEFVDGPEFALDFVYTGGEFYLLGIHDKPSAWAGNTFIERVYITPPDVDAAQQQVLADVAVRGLAAVGATTGAAHVEIRLSSQGPTIIEINGRLGGTAAYVQESIRAATGVWGPREYLRAVLGERPQVATSTVTAGFIALLAEQTGRIQRFDGAEETAAIPGIQGIRWMAQPGDDVVIDYPANPVSCFALALATGASHQEVLDTLTQAEQTLTAVVSDHVPAQVAK